MSGAERDAGPAAEEVAALYDPADVCGRVVGAAPRSRVRAENLPHAATGVIVRRSDGRVLVHRRADSKDVWPSLTDCASGGVVLDGEAPDVAARRELGEELGFEPDRLDLLMTSWYRDDTTQYLAHLYRTVWDGPVTFADGEVAQAWWETPQDVLRRIADPGSDLVPDTRRLISLLVGSRTGPVTQPWPAGATVVHRWGRAGRTGSARVARVVRHKADGLLTWVAPGNPTVEPVAIDGRGLREVPLPERGSVPRSRRCGAWRGGGALIWVPGGGQGWSVWWFFDADGRFTGWYGNLEAPAVLRRTASGTCLVDTTDHALDVVIAPDGTASWKDEDEFAAYTGLPGRWREAEASGIRAAGEELIALAARAQPPFDGRWTDFTPDPGWSAPRFPPDWDVPHAGPR